MTSGGSKPENAGTGTAPRLGVHVLSEFTFCPRAGLIAMGQEPDDRGDDYWLRPNLDFRPSFTFYELRLGILRESLLVATLMIVSGAVAGGCMVLHQGDNTVAFGAGVLLLVLLGWPLIRGVSRLLTLRAEWARIASLSPREPDPASTRPERVVWWELLRAGFDPVRVPDSLVSPVLALAGRPWRVLRKGDLAIPVFRLESSEPGRLYPKHTVRAAAYCRLLEQSAGASSPYAIALFAGTYEGWTIPITPGVEGYFDQVFAAARSSLSADVMFAPPEDRAICRRCPHGVPRVYRRGVSETSLFEALIRPHGASARSGIVYHSTCGDRFHWSPPHEDAVASGIRVDAADSS